MIVVTGATGNVGRPLVRALRKAGQPVSAVSRGISAHDVPLGVRCLRGDLADPESLKPALAGAAALFLLTSGDFLAAGRDLGDVLDAARVSGVRRVVLLSSQGVGTKRQPADLEDAVTRSGLGWTILRPSGFNSNTLLWADRVRTQRVVAAPFADVALPAIDPADVAEVASVVLRGGHGGRTYELTGPEPISPRQQAAVIGQALGEEVRFAELSREEARGQMLRFMSEQIVDRSLMILGAPSSAEQRVSPEVERILGRPPGTFAEWVRRNVTAFR